MYRLGAIWVAFAIVVAGCQPADDGAVASAAAVPAPPVITSVAHVEGITWFEGGIGELDGPDRIHARARTRLVRLDAALADWVADTGNADALETIAGRWKHICARLPSTDTARAGCAELLG